MLNRLFVVSVRLRVFLAGLGILGLIAPPADAALKKYALHGPSLIHYDNTSPEVSTVDSQHNPGEVVLIDETGPSPVLKKLLSVAGSLDNTGVTVVVPQLSGGFIFIRQRSSAGPAPDQSGTGSTASSINWGNVTGWTLTGGTFCHAIPSYICNLAARVELETVPPPLNSTNYDFGTWTFHGTGFSLGEYISRTSTDATGNSQVVFRGSLRADGTVPALPLLGIGAVGISVIAMGAASARRRKS